MCDQNNMKQFWTTRRGCQGSGFEPRACEEMKEEEEGAEEVEENTGDPSLVLSFIYTNTFTSSCLFILPLLHPCHFKERHVHKSPYAEPASQLASQSVRAGTNNEGQQFQSYWVLLTSNSGVTVELSDAKAQQKYRLCSNLLFTHLLTLSLVHSFACSSTCSFSHTSTHSLSLVCSFFHLLIHWCHYVTSRKGHTQMSLHWASQCERGVMKLQWFYRHWALLTRSSGVPR